MNNIISAFLFAVVLVVIANCADSIRVEAHEPADTVQVNSNQISSRRNLASIVHVYGEVIKPGSYKVNNRGIAYAINIAGGVTDRTCGRSVRVSGAGKSGENAGARIDIKTIVENKGQDVLLPDNWIVSLPQSILGCSGPDKQALENYVTEVSNMPGQQFDMRLINEFNAH